MKINETYDMEDDMEDDILEEIPEEELKEIKKVTDQAVIKTPEEIMEKYNSGKELIEKTEPVIRSVLDLNEKDKLPKIILNLEPVAPEVEEIYIQAVKDYNRGMQMTLDAKEEMILKLDMLIYYVIKGRFATFKKYTKDLYQEGVLGILKGIDSYDVSKGKPTTYFYIYILHEMTEYINANINKTTSHYSANIIKVKKAINHFEHEGREWTIKDIAQETGISAETILQSLKIMESSKEVHYNTVDYLDKEMNKRSDSPEEEYLKKETSEILMKAIKSLSEEEAAVITLRFGLGGEVAMSFKNIAIRLGMQIDKVRKYNAGGIRKLRRNKTIHGTFNLGKEERALNGNYLGIEPIEIAEKLMDELLQIKI